ncbi:MAG: class II aldolase/adducin family protein, partial [Bdellovibrionales bacterium]|nr:class II aldolase/adducin family protein [Bdellovibrionales bacterium]
IGHYPDGISFGNVSKRVGTSEQFVISGTQTGAVARATVQHFTTVTSYDIEGNRVTCRGPLRASSESLTHAALYRIDPQIGAVVHIHNATLWKKFYGELPTTDASVPYGTPGMAREIERLYRRCVYPNHYVILMGGHQDGLISFGQDVERASEAMLSFLPDPN